MVRICHFINIYQFFYNKINLIFVYKVNKTIKWLAQNLKTKLCSRPKLTLYPVQFYRWHRTRYTKNSYFYLISSFSDLHDGTLLANMKSLPIFPFINFSPIFSVHFCLRESHQIYLNLYNFLKWVQNHVLAPWCLISNDLNDND